MTKLTLSLLSAACCFSATAVFAQAPPTDGYRIEVSINGFEGDELYLANYYLDKQYIVDTVPYVDGRAVFTSDTGRLAEGMYLLVTPPDNDYAQLFIDADQEFTLETSINELTAMMRVEGSEQNAAFFAYLQQLDALRPRADSLRAVATDSTLPQNRRDEARALVADIDERVVAEQDRIRETYADLQFGKLMRSFQEPEIPEFEGTPDEIQRQQYLYYKDHYFDNVDLADERGLRSTYLDQKISYYLDKLVVPVPDSLNVELDYLLGEMSESPQLFRAYVSKFLNEYAASKIVGQDAVYAHLGENYYMAGRTPWVDSATLAKIGENVEKLKPLLIGQPAPPLETQTADGAFDLYDLDASYTVLFFFDPECGVCKKQTPVMVDFARDYADEGVKVVSVCTKLGQDASDCWDYVEEKEGMAENIINTNDPYHRSRFKISYDVVSTPQIYVLDENKKIVSKKIGADQLGDVIDRLIELEALPREGAATEAGE